MPWFLLSALLICGGCSGPAIGPDADGHSPGDVVLAAYEAAIAGDFDKANSFGTPDFVAHEEGMRKAIAAGQISNGVDLKQLRIDAAPSTLRRRTGD